MMQKCISIVCSEFCSVHSFKNQKYPRGGGGERRRRREEEEEERGGGERTEEEERGRGGTGGVGGNTSGRIWQEAKASARSGSLESFNI